MSELRSVVGPYDQALGLEGKRTYHWQGLKRSIEQAVQTSYRRAAKAHPEAPSSSTLHRRMQNAPSLPLWEKAADEAGAGETTRDCLPAPAAAAPAAVGTGLVDGTRIPAQRADTQHSLVLAHAVRPSQASGGQGIRDSLSLERTVLSAYAEPEAEVSNRLRKNQVRPAALLGDGRTDLSDTAPLGGRGRWHVPHTAGLLLYRDGFRKDRHRRLRKQVTDLVFEEASPSERRRAIARWVWAMRHVAPLAARHLLNAAEGLARMDANPEAFVVETTAPIEREMHEVGRRFENGGHGNLRFPRAESGIFFAGAPCGSSGAAVIFLVHFWIQPKMNAPCGKGELTYWWQYSLRKRNQSSGN